MSLYVLCCRESWDKIPARIKRLPTQATVDELFYQDEFGQTTFAIASFRTAPVEVLESMLLLGNLDAEKRNILDIAADDLRLPLHNTAHYHPSPNAIKLLVRRHHPALLAKDSDGFTPLGLAIKHNESADVEDLLNRLTIAYEHDHFSALVRLCGTSDELQALAVSSTDDLSLLVLCKCGSWDAMSKRIETEPTQDAIEEMHELDDNEEGRTTFATAVVAGAPVELLESMFKLAKLDTMERDLAHVSDKDKHFPLYLAALHRTDVASIKLLAREQPTGLGSALNCARAAYEHNKKSTAVDAVVSLLSKCSFAFDHGNVSAVIDLCGKSDSLLWHKDYMERLPVHAAAFRARDIAIIKPVIREHAADLLYEDTNGLTPLGCAKRNNQNPAVVSFMTEVDTAFHNTDYPALIRLCGSTPDWEKKAKHYKDKKKAEEEAAADALAAKFFDWDEKDTKKKQPEKKPKKPKKKKEKKEEKVEMSLAEQMAVVDSLSTRKKEEAAELSLAEQMAEMEKQIAELPTLASVSPPPPPPVQTDEEALAAIYHKLLEYPPPPKMKFTSILLTCEDEVGLPGDGTTAERVAALKLLVQT